MVLPIREPISPMLAVSAPSVPIGPEWSYEPKWDGFRCIVLRDGDDVELASRNERPLTRYFPELCESLRAELPHACVLDGEVVIAGPEGLDFDALLQRIHPASSRVQELAARTPASFVAFDLLALGDEDLRTAPFVARRARLEEALRDSAPPVHLTPLTSDPEIAGDWFARFEGAGLDGVVAKRRELAYVEGERVMVKVKHRRTADCVVGGFRRRKDDDSVGSLLLGLFDESGILHHVGVTASFTAAKRRALAEELAPYRLQPEANHPWSGSSEGSGSGRRPGTPSRWSAQKDLSFEPLRPELVCEVEFDHLQGARFRHAATFKRWRPDRAASSCGYSQIEAVVPAELSEVFGQGRRPR